MVSGDQEQEDIGHRADKLKKMIGETQEHYEALIDSAQIYKKGKMNEKEFLFKLGEYLKTMSSINFLSTQIILELKSVFEQNKRSLSGSSPVAESYSNVGPKKQSFSSVSSNTLNGNATYQETAPTFKPVTITLEKSVQDRNNREQASMRKCPKCGHVLSFRAKFCNKCGSSQ
ncbi:MAG: zinc ribbon domain-containing protein [Nitrososphaeraceae archaeon]